MTRRRSSLRPSAVGSASISRSSAALGSPVVERRNASRQVERRRPPRAGCGPPAPRPGRSRRRRRGAPAPRPPRRGGAAGGPAGRRRRRGRARARARGAATPRRRRRPGASASEGTSPSKKRSTVGRRLRADELVDDLAVLERLDRGDALDAEGLRERRVGVGVELGQHDLALAAAAAFSSTGVELPARAAPLGPEVDHDGHLVERSMTSCWKVASVTSMTVMGR